MLLFDRNLHLMTAHREDTVVVVVVVVVVVALCCLIGTFT